MVINDKFSSLEEIIFGDLGPLLFRIFLCDLSLFTNDTDIANYADDNTPHVSFWKDRVTCKVIERLEECSGDMFAWFENNELKAKPKKCQLFVNKKKTSTTVTSNNSGKIKIDINGAKIESRLSAIIDHQLTFKSHKCSVLKKAGQKFNSLTRISSYMDQKERRIIASAHINSQLSYCPLVRMMHIRTMNKKINRTHEKNFRIVYQDETSTFEEFFRKDNSIKIHARNLQTLATTMFEIKNK